ncbi:hypothetical protein [Bacillus cereus]|uniref:Uncharacterized protein n=1 Tax=Bacillus cereus TaxID=1396 RepID=A0A164P7W1_BACCE|nr:hypothetical protein [Bacillus cereus]KZD66371.1 hypothetical protein B4088_2487 [Bacillus cereus]
MKQHITNTVKIEKECKGLMFEKSLGKIHEEIYGPLQRSRQETQKLWLEKSTFLFNLMAKDWNQFTKGEYAKVDEQNSGANSYTTLQLELALMTKRYTKRGYELLLHFNEGHMQICIQNISNRDYILNEQLTWSEFTKISDVELSDIIESKIKEYLDSLFRVVYNPVYKEEHDMALYEEHNAMSLASSY